MSENTPAPDVDPTPDDEDPNADLDAEPDQSDEPLEFETDGFGPADPSDIPSADLTTEAQHVVET